LLVCRRLIQLARFHKNKAGRLLLGALALIHRVISVGGRRVDAKGAP
jgi:hypothetical protein